nr:hypothetical protein [Gordonia iterans]
MGSSAAMRRWREARVARSAARDELAAAECDAGERQRLSIRIRTALAVFAVLTVLGAAGAVWAAVERGPAYSDRELVDAATARVELLLTADADDQRRAREILSGATGEFHDEFAQSADAYSAFVQTHGSRGEAHIDGNALAARDGDVAVVLIAATVRVESGDEHGRRQLRLRVVVQPEDGVLKLAGVTFLP